MKISGSNIPITPAPYAARTGAVCRRRGPEARFDSVSITPREEGPGSFEQELKARLAQQVRSATTSGMITSLRERVQAGQYQPDPSAIASRIILMEGRE